MNYSQLCTPAMIYFVFSVIALIISFLSNFNIMSLIIKGFFIMLWSWFLNFLCSKGLTVISWILILLPFLMFLF
jgi:hypothetical protein